MTDLRRDWQKWTRTERFTAVVIAAMITAIVPAAVEFTHQTTPASARSHILAR